MIVSVYRADRRQRALSVLDNLRQSGHSDVTQRLPILIEHLTRDDAGLRHLQLQSGDSLPLRNRKVQSPSFRIALAVLGGLIHATNSDRDQAILSFLEIAESE